MRHGNGERRHGNRQMTATQLAARMGTAEGPVVIDVREPEEVAAWPLAGAVNIPLGQLASRLNEVPADRQVAVICASGNRSASATAFLARSGVEAVNVAGGMLAWAGVYDTAEVRLGPVTVTQVRRRGKGCLSYLVGCGGEAYAVDPSLEVSVYRELAGERGWNLTRVFDTHLHADHLSGARDLAALSGASIHLNPADTFRFPFEPLRDGQTFVLGEAVEVSVSTVHTPGHTEGSTVFHLDGALLTGDTLFVDGVGRPDLAETAEQFARNLHGSLARSVLPRSDDTVVLPSHYGDGVQVRPGEPVAARLGELRERLDTLSLGEDEFVDWAVSRATPRPPHYREIIRANIGEPELPPSELRRLEAGPNRCAA